MNELIGIDKMYASFQKKWAKSFFIILAMIIGIFIGMVIVRSDILNDCKFLGGFRIGDSSFTCARKI
jgi:hypothetical protein